MFSQFRFEWLPNGLLRVDDLACKWSGTYKKDGSVNGGPNTKNMNAAAKAYLNGLI